MSWRLFVLALVLLPPVPAPAGICSGKVLELLQRWREVPTEGARAVEVSHRPFESRLTEFYAGRTPGPEYVGGEGRIYTQPDARPGLALKRWKRDRLPDFADGVDFLVAGRELVDSMPELHRRLEVVRIQERGPDWILREFRANSKPLADVFQTDPWARAALSDLRRTCNRYQARSPIIQRLQRMLMTTPPSVNLHWDASARKVLLIDGF